MTRKSPGRLQKLGFFFDAVGTSLSLEPGYEDKCDYFSGAAMNIVCGYATQSGLLIVAELSNQISYLEVVESVQQLYNNSAHNDIMECRVFLEGCHWRI